MYEKVYVVLIQLLGQGDVGVVVNLNDKKIKLNYVE